MSAILSAKGFQQVATNPAWSFGALIFDFVSCWLATKAGLHSWATV